MRSLLVGGLLAAPFLALLFGREAGLTVAVVALLAVSYLAYLTLPGAGGRARSALITMVAVNVALAAICLAVLGWLVVRG